MAQFQTLYLNPDLDYWVYIIYIIISNGVFVEFQKLLNKNRVFSVHVDYIKYLINVEIRWNLRLNREICKNQSYQWHSNSGTKSKVKEPLSLAWCSCTCNWINEHLPMSRANQIDCKGRCLVRVIHAAQESFQIRNVYFGNLFGFWLKATYSQNIIISCVISILIF